MKKTKQVHIKNDELCMRIEQFNKRWNVINDEEDLVNFKNRILFIVESEFYSFTISERNESRINSFCNYIGFILGLEPDTSVHNCHIEQTTLYKKISKLSFKDDNDYLMIIKFAESFINYDGFELFKREEKVNKVLEAAKLSNVNIIICNEQNYYAIYPGNDPEFDRKLIVDVLSWLDDYPKSKKEYKKALKFPKTESNYRNIVDSLRLSFELFCKSFFENEKSLENQKSDLGNYLKDKNISIELSNMYIKLFNYYCLYNNNNAKHNNSILKVEIDYMIYLTGTFIRFLIMVEKSKKD